MLESRMLRKIFGPEKYKNLSVCNMSIGELVT
jgi:hypothetical protein